MIDLFSKVISCAIELLKIKKLRTSDFVSQVITPIHERFEEFCSQHMDSFRKMADMAEEKASPKKIYDTLSDSIRIQQHHWKIFRELDELGDLAPENIKSPVKKYLKSLKSCLNNLRLLGDDTIDDSLIYYYSLLRYLERLIAIEADGGDVFRQEQAEFLAQVHHAMQSFQGYRSNVEMSYLRIKAEAIIK